MPTAICPEHIDQVLRPGKACPCCTAAEAQPPPALRNQPRHRPDVDELNAEIRRRGRGPEAPRPRGT